MVCWVVAWDCESSCRSPVAVASVRLTVAFAVARKFSLACSCANPKVCTDAARLPMAASKSAVGTGCAAPSVGGVKMLAWVKNCYYQGCLNHGRKLVARLNKVLKLVVFLAVV